MSWAGREFRLRENQTGSSKGTAAARLIEPCLDLLLSSPLSAPQGSASAPAAVCLTHGEGRVRAAGRALGPLGPPCGCVSEWSPIHPELRV